MVLNCGVIQASTPKGFSDYELIDSGNGAKLERFGGYVLWRPEPQAVWSPHLSEAEWEKLAHTRFQPDGSSAGSWNHFREMPDQWFITYHSKGMKLRFRLGLTRFKHVGIFPEQAYNWDFIYRQCKARPGASVLNLFAYTGGASLAAKAASADVIHCDSIRQVVNWAKVNMEASRLDNIRWLVEDAFKFVKREAARGRTYQGIILDPPAWGHGPKGEKWKLDDQINELVKYVTNILAPKNYFLVFNAYSLGYSPLILENLIRTHLPSDKIRYLEKGELYLPDKYQRKLPAGIYARFSDLP